MRNYLNMILLIVAISTVWGIYYFDRRRNMFKNTFKQKKIHGTKYVHFWNRPGWISRHEFFGCDVKCEMTEGNFIPETSDAVIFHSPSVWLTKPPRKPRGQIWVFQGQEPPMNYLLSYRSWRNVFNWTMSYRRDADIYQPYGTFNVTKPKHRDYFKSWTKKSKTIAWFVSNCHTQSKREKFVKLLNKHFNIDIFGRCGDKYCQRKGGGDRKCLEMLHNTHMFYLSFESSLCRDYITEKFFKVYTQPSQSVIPVVRGNNIYGIYGPPYSYINTANFTSVSRLARYLISMSTDYTKYSSFFTSRANFDVVQDINSRSFCNLCWHVHNGSGHARLYDDIGAWFYGTKDVKICEAPADLR